MTRDTQTARTHPLQGAPPNQLKSARVLLPLLLGERCSNQGCKRRSIRKHLSTICLLNAAETDPESPLESIAPTSAAAAQMLINDGAAKVQMWQAPRQQARKTNMACCGPATPEQGRCQEKSPQIQPEWLKAATHRRSKARLLSFQGRWTKRSTAAASRKTCRDTNQKLLARCRRAGDHHPPSEMQMLCRRLLCPYA